MTTPDDANWSRSSFCGASAGCVDVRRDGDKIQVRDSKLGDHSLIQEWPLDDWRDLIAALAQGDDHLEVELVDDGAWLATVHADALFFNRDEWNAFVAGVKAGEFDPEKLSSPASSEGCDAGQPVGVGGGSNLAATGAGAIAVPPVPVAASWDPTSPQHAVIRAAIKWRNWFDDRPVDLLHAGPQEVALILAVDELPHIGEPAVPVAAAAAAAEPADKAFVLFDHHLDMEVWYRDDAVAAEARASSGSHYDERWFKVGDYDGDPLCWENVLKANSDIQPVLLVRAP